MNLFEVDIFSNCKPQWNKVTKEFSEDLIRNLRFSNVNLDFDSIDGIFYCGGNEINSKNYFIKSKLFCYVIKNWGNKSKSEINRIIKIQNWLENSGLPVISAIRNDIEEPLSINNSYWDLFPFVDGDYFSGSKNEYFRALNSIDHLHKNLNKLPLELQPNNSRIYFSSEEIELMNDINIGIMDIKKYIPEDTAYLLKNHWYFIYNFWLRAKEELIDKINLDLKPSHFDLHPHNIIMVDGKVGSFLDFESCALLNPKVALSFAYIKLGRQAAISQEHSKIKSILSLHLNHLSSQISPRECYQYSVLEFIRRIRTIKRKLGFI